MSTYDKRWYLCEIRGASWWLWGPQIARYYVSDETMDVRVLGQTR